jgi:MFS family permease
MATDRTKWSIPFCIVSILLPLSMPIWSFLLADAMHDTHFNNATLPRIMIAAGSAGLLAGAIGTASGRRWTRGASIVGMALNVLVTFLLLSVLLVFAGAIR